MMFTPSVQHYMLQLTINGSSPVNTTVPSSTTTVDIFNTFQSVAKEKYTLYSLRVAAINSAGISSFSDSVSVGKLSIYMTVVGVKRVFCIKYH